MMSIKHFPRPLSHGGLECKHSVSRRRFFGTAAGAALASGLWTPLRALSLDDDDPTPDLTPKPIPGGVSPFGVFIHHFPLPAPGTPLDQITDPSQIFDFNGFVGGTRIRGSGTGTDTTTGATTPLNFQADMGFMKGSYIGQGGGRHHGTFGFI
jgi:hypothetical protein